jgi:DNA-binding beta-propeller fold protein YncE
VPQSTIPVGTAPIWADFAPTLNEMLVLNQGNGTGPGSVSIVNIPLCSALAILPNQNCDTSNPIDAVGFGQVIATIPVGVNPVMIACLQDGTQCYVANAGNPNLPCAAPTGTAIPNCSISVINLATDTVVATIPAVSGDINQADSYVHGRPNYIAATTGTPTGKIYVTSGDAQDISIIRTDLDAITAHLALQGYGVSVRVSQP